MITEALKEAIRQQDFQYTGEVVAHQLKVKTVLEVHKLSAIRALIGVIEATQR